jgi:sugar/nucleoside kinase (ribokinase family)
MKVVLVGHVCIDHNISEHAAYSSWGSAVMHMAHYFRDHAGVEPVVIASRGQDFEPYAKNVTLLPAAPSSSKTLIYKNVTHDGKRTQRCENSSSAEPAPLGSNAIKAIAEADILVVAPLLPNFSVDYIQRLLGHTKASCLTALLPQGYFRAVTNQQAVAPRTFTEASKIMPLFDLAILSEDDYPDVREAAEKWASSHTEIIITQGPHGASLVTPDGFVSVPTHPVPEDRIVDSVGCGDIFSAALILNLFKEKDLVQAIGSGNKAARAKLFTAERV